MAGQLRIRNFLPARVSGDIRTDPVAAMTTSMNRIGFVVSDIGNLIVDMYQDKIDTVKNARRGRTLSKDKAREGKIEKRIAPEVKKQAEKETGNSDKKAATWIEKLLSPFVWILEKAAIWFTLDFVSNPKNKEFLGKTLNVIGKWLGTFWKVFSTGVGWLLEAFGEKSPIMGGLKILGGLAALFVADRILKPWKLLGDFQKLSKFLGPGIKKLGQVLSQGTKKLATKGLSGAKAFATNPMAMSLTAGVVSTTSRLAAGETVQNAVGGGIGATVGSMALTAFLTPILGPFAPLVGSLVGGFIGDKIGAFLGDAMTPIFGPIKDYFVDVFWPAFKAFIDPVVGPVMDLFEELSPILKGIAEFLGPLMGPAVQAIGKFLGEGMEPLFTGLIWIIKTGARAIADFVEGAEDLGSRIDMAGVWTSDVKKAGQEFRDREREVEKHKRAQKDAKKKLGQLIIMRDQKFDGDPDGKNRSWRYTIGERIQFEEEHIQDLADELIEREKRVVKAKEKWEREKELDKERQAEEWAAAESGTGGEGNRGHVVTSEAMKERSLKLSPGMHMGVDIAGAVGEELKAFLGGTVQQTGFDKGFGNYIAWTSSDGMGQFFAHMKEMSKFKAGDTFSAGAVLGLLGNTGQSTGPHLHWETSTNPNDVGRPKDNPLSRINPLSKYGKESPFTGVAEPSAAITPSEGGQGGGINSELKDRSIQDASGQFAGPGTTEPFVIQPMIKEIHKTGQGATVHHITKPAKVGLS